MTGAKDGLGQSLRDDWRWFRRFRRARRLSVPWRMPTPDERRSICDDPLLGRFADDAVALADWQGRRWIVMERTWSGWPDPPTYVLFVLDGGAIWLARDFDRWPSAWREPWWEGPEGRERKRRMDERRAAGFRPFREALLILAGAPLAYAGWRAGTWLAGRDPQDFERMMPPGLDAAAFVGLVFALAAATRLFGQPLRSRMRRMAARRRALARLRWGRGRDRAEFARVYRSAVWGACLAAALLAAAVLAGFGFDGLDQSLAVIMVLVLAIFSRLALGVFALAGRRAARWLPICLAAGVLAGAFGGP